MSRDHTQEALDEYYSTGIDPTGGEICPDDLDETEQAFYEEQSEFDAGADVRACFDCFWELLRIEWI